MKLHGKDKLMIVDIKEGTLTEFKGCYRVIDSRFNRTFTVKYFDKDAGKYKSRRFSKDRYGYNVRRDPNWKPSTVRNPA